MMGALALAGCSAEERLRREAHEAALEKIHDRDSAWFSATDKDWTFPRQRLVCGDVSLQRGSYDFIGYAYRADEGAFLNTDNPDEWARLTSACMAARGGQTPEGSKPQTLSDHAGEMGHQGSVDRDGG